LGEEVRVDAFAGFVAWPEAIAKGLDDVIRGNGEVGGTGVKHAEDGGQDTTYRGDFAAIAIAG
jgi:acetyl-CoA carboxylase carboxyltransferase component